MIDTRNHDYEQTLWWFDELRELTDRLEENVSLQLPQGVANEFVSAKNELINWMEEVEFILRQDYKA